MKIFLTGATGYIGGAVARAAARAGHQVLALAHSEKATATARENGWTPAPGDLREPATLAKHAAAADATLHTANTNAEDAGEADRAAVGAMLEALAGSGKPLVYTSGIWVLGDTGGREADEQTPADRPLPMVAWRARFESEVVAAAERGVRSVVVRPGIVYGRGGGIPGMLGRGELPLVGDGRQSWPLVHLDDLAELYLLALEAPAGSILHAVSAHATMKDVALAARAGEGHPGDYETLSRDQAKQRLGGFGEALALDQRFSAERTRELVGWTPRAPGFVEALMASS